jgi:hypothetical protein
MTLLVAAAAVAFLAGCSGDPGAEPPAVTSPVTLPTELDPTAPTSAPGSTPTPSAPAPSAAPAEGLRIESFAVRAPLTCDGTEFTARAEWTASGAVGATIVVDGATLDAPVPVAGPVDLTLPCDGSAHPVLLVLAAADGSTVVGSQAVLASPAR